LQAGGAEFGSDTVRPAFPAATILSLSPSLTTRLGNDRFPGHVIGSLEKPSA